MLSGIYIFKSENSAVAEALRILNAIFKCFIVKEYGVASVCSSCLYYCNICAAIGYKTKIGSTFHLKTSSTFMRGPIGKNNSAVVFGITTKLFGFNKKSFGIKLFICPVIVKLVRLTVSQQCTQPYHE